jgi:hypothetical protein
MTRIWAVAFALGLGTILVTQGSPNAQAAECSPRCYLKYQLEPLGKKSGPALKSRERKPQRDLRSRRKIPKS